MFRSGKAWAAARAGGDTTRPTGCSSPIQSRCTRSSASVGMIGLSSHRPQVGDPYRFDASGAHSIAILDSRGLSCQLLADSLETSFPVTSIRLELPTLLVAEERKLDHVPIAASPLDQTAL